MVKLGHIQILILTVYLHPPGGNHSPGMVTHNNQCIMQQCLRRVQEWTGHSIICGDFNSPPTAMAEWASLSHLGFREAHSLCRDKFGRETPPTFQDSTRNDSALISPGLIHSVSDIQVIRDHTFANHHPLVISFLADHIEIHKLQWRLPKSLSPEQIGFLDPNSLVNNYLAISGSVTHHDYPDPTLRWSVCVEKSLKTTLRDRHELDPCCKPMTSGQLGRGRIPPYKFSRYSTGHRFGRPGDFQPHEEATSVLHKQIVRQMRRIHSLSRILKKDPIVTENPVAMADWSAILRAPGFPPCFPTWVLQTGQILLWPSTPTPTFMDTLASIVEGYLNETSKLARSARTIPFARISITPGSPRGIG